MKTPAEIAKQLRCPQGVAAVEFAEGMNHANQALNLRCIELLQIKALDQILEIGPGNACFAENMLCSASQVTYVGLDWSAPALDAAKHLNAHRISMGQAEFILADCAELPLAAQRFNKVLTVHTLYFWPDVLAQLKEIKRVMQQGAIFCLAFGEKSFMQDLAFTEHGFTLYDAVDVAALLENAGFEVLHHEQLKETGISNMGTKVEKTNNIFLCSINKAFA